MTTPRRPFDHVHADGRRARGGMAPQHADRSMILVHGPGATPEPILALADDLDWVVETMRRLTTHHQREMSEVGARTR